MVMTWCRVSSVSCTLTNWPGQMASVVGEARLELDRAGGGIDVVVGDAELTAAQQRAALLAERLGQQRPAESRRKGPEAAGSRLRAR